MANESFEIDEDFENYLNECEYEEEIKQRPNSYKQKVRHKNKLKRMAKELTHCPYPAIPLDKNREYIDKVDDAEYIKREYRGKRSAYLKKLGNHRVRRYEGEIPSGCGYKRLFDYWWELI